MTRTLLFDIDGTLIDTGGAGRVAMNLALEKQFAITPTVPLSFGGRTDRSLLSEMLSVHGIEVSDETFDQLRATFVLQMPDQLHQSAGRVLPGVIELLDHLAGRDEVRLWCMTGNLVETAQSKLRHFGLLGYFEQIIGGDHDEQRDDMARRASAMLKTNFGDLATQNVVVIGDTVADIDCARAIGARVLACCTGCHSREILSAANPCAIVDDFSDTEAIASLLLGAI